MERRQWREEEKWEGERLIPSSRTQTYSRSRVLRARPRPPARKHGINFVSDYQTVYNSYKALYCLLRDLHFSGEEGSHPHSAAHNT